MYTKDSLASGASGFDNADGALFTSAALSRYARRVR
jgi:hypothetical protein